MGDKTTEVKRTERGWAGHFCCSSDCNFRRNTLLEAGDTKIVISTVGANFMKGRGFIPVNAVKNIYYETMAFFADLNSKWLDANVGLQINFDSSWYIGDIKEGSDIRANEMHELVVEEITNKLAAGKTYREIL